MYSGVTVRRILQRPEFAGARVLGGENNLDRVVTSVTVAEIPDIARWLNGNDFVHGVGRLFARSDGSVDEEGLYQWVRDLIDGGAACLAIKTRRYIKELPAAVIQLGDEAGFPIIELPDGVIQGQVSEIIFQMILEAGQEREQQRTRLFTEMVRDLTGPHLLSHDARRMAVYLGYPIAIVDACYAFLGTSFTGAEEESTDLSALQQGIKKAVAAGEQLSKVTVTDDQILVGYVDTDTHGAQRQLVVAGITYKGQNLGYVCLVGNEDPICPDTIYFFASLAEVITVDMSQNMMVETSSLISRSDFFAVISEPEVDERKALHLADLIGLNYVQPMRVAVIALGAKAKNFAPEFSFLGEEERKAVSYISQYLRSTLARSEEYFVCAWERGVAVIFMGERYSAERYSAIVQAAVRQLSSALHVADVIAGIGQGGHGIAGVHESAENALYALKCIETFSLTEQVIRYDELGPYLFLSAALCSADASRKYVDFVLGPLLNQESEYRDELIDTLFVYLETGGSYAAASKKLRVHVNTVRYRISKIAELLPVDLSSVDGKGSVWLAMRINTLLATSMQSSGGPSCG
ncbi:MAG: PucR family transcriptional regulator ligand-binding domain-containing protein [Actinomycetaceae bacterium]|nr:PucR family transcriptional regulator ligand-binding domain-containing protein [Actinomycetaceae bacterium]MDY5854095.1 PucR family transcriptional regulator ligand-binding domain-containing protein [Arcanobacterium sp.]